MSHRSQQPFQVIVFIRTFQGQGAVLVLNPGLRAKRESSTDLHLHPQTIPFKQTFGRILITVVLLLVSRVVQLKELHGLVSLTLGHRVLGNDLGECVIR